MVAEGYFTGTYFPGKAVKAAAAQPRAEPAGRLALGNHLAHDAVGVFFQHLVALLYHVVIDNGVTHIATQPLLQLVELSFVLAGKLLHDVFAGVALVGAQFTR